MDEVKHFHLGLRYKLVFFSTFHLRSIFIMNFKHLNVFCSCTMCSAVRELASQHTRFFMFNSHGTNGCRLFYARINILLYLTINMA